MPSGTLSAERNEPNQKTSGVKTVSSLYNFSIPNFLALSMTRNEQVTNHSFRSALQFSTISTCSISSFKITIKEDLSSSSRKKTAP